MSIVQRGRVVILTFALAIAAQISHADCGYATHLKEVHFTEALIVKRVALRDLIGEMPTRLGHPACVRLTFSIDTTGHAGDITVEESSGDYLMTAAAMRALRAYRFMPTTAHRRHMLVFRGVINKAPPFPDGAH